MRSDSYLYTFNKGDDAGSLRLQHYKDLIKALNAQAIKEYERAVSFNLKHDRPLPSRPMLKKVRVMGRNEDRRQGGKHYKQTIPLKYSTRFDVYCYERVLPVVQQQHFKGVLC